jgi:glucokinase
MKGCILGADIGGTNTSIGIFDFSLKQILSFAYSTTYVHPYSSISQAAAEAKKKEMLIKAAGIAVAGPVGEGKVHLTNAGVSLSSGKIKKMLKTKKVAMINDFEAVAYGVQMLGKGITIPLTKNKPMQKGIKVVLGAGTGLGKAVLYFDEKKGFYVPLRAEEGHTAIALTEGEFPLMDFIRKRKKADVAWEDVLSGRGIATLYDFVGRTTRGSQELARTINAAADKAGVIAQHRKTDSRCREAFAMFSRIYARFIRNSMLAALPYGGVYIAGGIARKNADMFSSREFRNELYKKATYANIIKRIPLYVVKDSRVGVKGAAFCALRC